MVLMSRATNADGRVCPVISTQRSDRPIRSCPRMTATSADLQITDPCFFADDQSRATNQGRRPPHFAFHRTLSVVSGLRRSHHSANRKQRTAHCSPSQRLCL